MQKIIDEIFPVDFNYEIHKVYIPILRGLRPIHWVNPAANFYMRIIIEAELLKTTFVKTLTKIKSKPLLALAYTQTPKQCF